MLIASVIEYYLKMGTHKSLKLFSTVEGNDKNEGKLWLNGQCQTLPIFKSLFYKVQTVYRQESCLGAFVSVCGCSNEKTVQALKQNKFSSL